MIFAYLSENNTKHVHEYFDHEVYRYDEIPNNSCFASTPNFDSSYYFLKNAHGTYVALDRLISSYSTSVNDVRYLHSIKQQYVPEILI